MTDYSNQSPHENGNNEESRKEKKTITRNIFIVVVVFLAAVGIYMFTHHAPEPGESPAGSAPASTVTTSSSPQHN